MRIVLRGVAIVVLAVVIVIALYAGNISVGMHSTATVNGTIAGTGIAAPTLILRDARGVPHIRAANEHDAFFAEGYVMAQDRLFQLDLLRRFVYGELSEVLGNAVVASDEKARVVPVRAIVDAQWQKLDTAGAGNAAGLCRRRQRRNETREDTGRVSHPQLRHAPMAPARLPRRLVCNRARSHRRLERYRGAHRERAAATDPCYDAPVTEGLAHIADPANCSVKNARSALIRSLLDPRPPIGSNEWAAGAAHTATHRALLANDPHLALAIPGVWYLVDMQSPGFHVAGAALVGTPGVTLGHNDHVAWGATNGTVTALSIFDAPPSLDATKWQTETFHVRFAHDVTARYYRGVREFGATINVRGAPRFILVRWNAYATPNAPLTAFNGLDRARTIEDALAALRTYPGPTQNFELADASGRVAYQLAGSIPNDPFWARDIHPASDLAKQYAAVPFDGLPRVAASRDAIVWTSNNKMYGASYPLRFRPHLQHRAAPTASPSCCARARRTTSPTSPRCRWTRSRSANARLPQTFPR